jgi:hypothetical protein
VYHFKEFVASLREVSDKVDDTKELLKYEPVIRYAHFPALDLNVSGWDRAGDTHNEVFDVLTWLRLRGVQKIVKLKVLDRMYNPHDEQEIANQVDMFEVEILDWRYLDLSISVFTTPTRDRLKELHLYSSGKLAPIDHWLGENGVKSLNKVCEQLALLKLV